MKRIVIAEDDQDIREILRKILIKAGYEVFVAANGKDAVSLCNNYSVDLAILDIGMPDLDGYQVCDELKNSPKTKNVNVLYLTGTELEPKGIIERCEATGARGFIKKPCDTQELLNKIKEIIG